MSFDEQSVLRIDMVSDVVCPWCTIGYQRLQKALSQFPDLKVELSFKPFELNPAMPPEGQNVNEHIAEKYGLDVPTIEHNRLQLRAVAAEEGVTFTSDSESRIYNTFLAHKLLLRAEAMGTQTALKLALFRAYFEERRNISDAETLVDIAEQNGFSREQAMAALEDEALSQAVRIEENAYRSMGITAVPTFIFNQQYSVSGAQDAGVLGNVIQEITALLR
ncbi:DsbA family oxidoreductase [Pseudomaricurvus alkylphenolicus]|uniref:DsbA family oxidoreductase n=1 Tax=Pseudomaricurvus alkylphenolicus TaxID=1306991 RepID=UPI001422326F|nr:DsbA family oxidoreductase [Pseudomaricurvus alkylphenolicus]NIB41572.1 DsbA family oxidoreductase [Pseudomaricurvus alkylphenolicus]